MDQPLDKLRAITSDYSSEWSSELSLLFRQVNSDIPEIFKRNYFHLLRSRDRRLLHYQRRLSESLKKSGFVAQIEQLWQRHQSSLTRISPIVKAHSEFAAKKKIAYFSMEYGFEGLPIYSGGLGILSGDHLRGASDLGLPLVAVGLLYLDGYYTQEVDLQGHMRVRYQSLIQNAEPLSHSHPLELVIDSRTKEPCLVALDFPGRTVFVQIWKLRIRNVDLLLLDTNVSKNNSHDRHITERLYPSKKNRQEERLRRLEQEMVLGIGGVRALLAAGYSFNAIHLNEGHVAFAILEACRIFQKRHKLSFADAIKKISKMIGFTTHTPVPEGNERFDESLVRSQLLVYFQSFMKPHDIEQIFKIARNEHGQFDMTQLSLGFSQAFRNGVSALHGSVCKTLWKKFFEERLKVKGPIPIGAITNAVHVPYWQKSELSTLIENHSGVGEIKNIPDAAIWDLKKHFKNDLKEKIKERLFNQSAHEPNGADYYTRQTHFLSHPDIFFIGFARRFAQYKRVTLLLDDEELLFNFLERSYQKYKKPIALVFAGKPHPDNHPGRNRIHQIYETERRLERTTRERHFEAKIFFIEGYDIDLARALEAGVDIWLNNPIRPLEASGTSGMKAGMNGTLNVSINDGWVPEGIRHGENGWIFGTNEGGTANQDRERLFELLEGSILPAYFARQNKSYDFSSSWVKMVKDSIQSMTSMFNTDRMLKDYIEKMYVPAFKAQVTL